MVAGKDTPDCSQGLKLNVSTSENWQRFLAEGEGGWSKERPNLGLPGGNGRFQSAKPSRGLGIDNC